MKYVSMRIPEAGPLGETSFEASVRAIVAASFVNNPGGGCVESVVTLAIHLFLFVAAINRLATWVFTEAMHSEGTRMDKARPKAKSRKS